MATNLDKVRSHLDGLLKLGTAQELVQSLMPSEEDPSPRISSASQITAEVIERRWQLLKPPPGVREQILDPQTQTQTPLFARNIENFIGTVKVPLGRCRSAARQRALRPGRLLRPAGDDRGGPGRLLQPRGPG